MTDQARTPNPLLVARVLPRGAAVILRDYRMTRRAGLAAQLKSVCTARGVKLLIGADVELAARIGADGVHFPGWIKNWPSVPEGMITTAACHSAGDLVSARAHAADLAIVSPAFATDSHPDATPLGADRFTLIAATAPMPVLALGGVTAANAQRLAGRNVVGLAAISAFVA